MTDIAKLGARLPAGDWNGLDALAPQVVDNPDGTFVIVATLRCEQLTTKVLTEQREARMVIARIEVLAGGHADQAREMLLAAYGQRTGRQTIPLRLEGGSLEDPGDEDDPR